MGWFVFAVIGILMIAMILLIPTPDQEDAKPGKLGDFRFPVTTEGTPVYLVWGTMRMRAPNVLWYGNFSVTKITEKVKTGLFSSKHVTVGFRYFVGMHLGICLHTGSAGAVFTKLWFGEDRVAWTGTASGTETLVNINKPGLLGGHKNGGGIVGPVRLYGGLDAQGVNSYLEGQIGSGDVPAYKGQCHAVFEKIEVGERASIEPVHFLIKVIPDALGFGEIGSSGDANPAEAIYDVLTNSWGRLNLVVGDIDTASFNAVATTLVAENHGMSLAIMRPNDAGEVLEEILRQIDGIIYEEPDTRKVHLKLIREDYDIDTVPVFGEEEIVEVVEYVKNQWSDTFNQVRVIFNDSVSDYNNRTAFAQDLSSISILGGIKSTNYRMPGISNAALANDIAARQLNGIARPLVKVKLAINRTATVLRPGDVFKWVWPDDNIVAMYLRVFEYDMGELEEGRVILTCFEDRFAVSYTVFADPPPPAFTPPTTQASKIVTHRVIELPRFLGKKIVDSGGVNGTDPDESYLGHHGLQPLASDVEFAAEVSDDTGASYFVDIADAAFAHSALVETAVDFDELEYDTVTGIRIKSITDSSILAAVSDVDLGNGVNMVLLNNELFCYKTFTDEGGGVYTLEDVWRGVLDTTPGNHAVDDRMYWVTQNEFDQFGFTNFVGTEATKTRYLTSTGFHVLDTATADVEDLTLQKRPQCALPPDLLTVNSTAHPTESTVDPVVLDWVRRDRLATTITRPNAADEAPESTTDYILRWRHNGGSWTEVNMGEVITHNLTTSQTTGTIDIEVYGQRDSDTTLRSLYPVTRTFTMNV